MNYTTWHDGVSEYSVRELTKVLVRTVLTEEQKAIYYERSQRHRGRRDLSAEELTCLITEWVVEELLTKL